ncbi:Membrane protein with Yip1 domain protein, partial [Spraguea lophii 42_110]
MNYEYTENTPHSIKDILTGYIPGDTPLLEELGINFNTIKREINLFSKIIFSSNSTKKDFFYTENNTYDTNDYILSDIDLSGPLLFIIIYSILLYINNSRNMNYIYFISISSISFIYFILNVLSNRSINDHDDKNNEDNDNKNIQYTDNSISLLAVISVLGYSFLPVMLSITIKLLLSIMFRNNYISIILYFIGVLYSALTATKVFVISLQLHRVFMLV